MKKYTGSFDKNTVRIYDGQTLFGSIDFSRERTAHADIYIYADRFHIGPESQSSKNIVLTKADVPIFTFAFDKLWGGARIQSGGSDTGFDIKGRWFRPCTRLTDENDQDLAVIVSDKLSGTEIAVEAQEDVDAIMVLSTLYYHLYASRSKMLSSILGSSFGGAI